MCCLFYTIPHSSGVGGAPHPVPSDHCVRLNKLNGPRPVQGVKDRSKGLLAWLGRHPGQLQLLADDIPFGLQLALGGWQDLHSPYAEDELLALLHPTVETIMKQHRGALVSQKVLLSDPYPTEGQEQAGQVGGAGAAGGRHGAEAAASVLEGHTSLTRLQLNGFRGSAADLAELLAVAPRLEQLHLEVVQTAMQPLLLAGVQAQPALCSMLVGLQCGLPAYAGNLREPSRIPEGLLGCTAITSLELHMNRHGMEGNPCPSNDLPQGISSLR